MPDQSLNIDPDSPALQYEIVEDQFGRWRLERVNDMPRTPHENLAVAEVRNVLPTDGHDRIYVPATTREEIDAEPGDVVSLVSVASAHLRVVLGAVQEAMGPFFEALHDITNGIMDALTEAFAETFTEDGGSDRHRDKRLPEHIQKARERRREQRERAREQTNTRFTNDGE